MRVQGLRSTLPSRTTGSVSIPVSRGAATSHLALTDPCPHGLGSHQPPAPSVPTSHHHREGGVELSPGVRARAATLPQEAEEFKFLFSGTSLVAQWLRIQLAMQGTWARSLVG